MTTATWDLDTVYFPNRGRIKAQIVETDPQLRAQLQQQARQLYREYLSYANSFNSDMRTYPLAAPGLRNTQRMYINRAQQLKDFANGKGRVPQWFANLYVHKASTEQLKNAGYDPTHPAWLTIGPGAKRTTPKALIGWNGRGRPPQTVQKGGHRWIFDGKYYYMQTRRRPPQRRRRSLLAEPQTITVGGVTYRHQGNVYVRVSPSAIAKVPAPSLPAPPRPRPVRRVVGRGRRPSPRRAAFHALLH